VYEPLCAAAGSHIVRERRGNPFQTSAPIYVSYQRSVNIRRVKWKLGKG